MKTYYEKIVFVKEKISSYLKEIFKVYGNELLLKLEEYNLLSNTNNCIESSTATGFIMEEFITSKLQIYTKDHNGLDDLIIYKVNQSTVKTSYDCYINYDGIFVMVNVKTEKDGSENNAVSSINSLYKDYVSNNSSQEKCFIILKFFYNFGISAFDNERKIIIRGVDVYCLEEINFSVGHQQDHRNWSNSFKHKSGRLKISKSFLKNNKLNKNDISYFKTKSFIEKIYNGESLEIKPKK